MTTLIVASLMSSACYWPSKAFIILSLGNGSKDTKVFTLGEDIYAKASGINVEKPAKLKYVLTVESVAGDSQGRELLDTSVDVDNAAVKLNIPDMTNPGEYKLDVTLIDRRGIEVANTSETFTVNMR